MLLPTIVLNHHYAHVPYSQLSTADLLQRALFLAAFCAFCLTLSGTTSMPVAGLALTAPAVIVIMLRVIVDGLDDPTSHNLWPFEALYGLVIGSCWAWPGAIVGRIFRPRGWAPPQARSRARAPRMSVPDIVSPASSSPPAPSNEPRRSWEERGIVVGAYAGWAPYSGSVVVKDRWSWQTIDRAERPEYFWACIAVYAALALALAFVF